MPIFFFFKFLVFSPLFPFFAMQISCHFVLVVFKYVYLFPSVFKPLVHFNLLVQLPASIVHFCQSIHHVDFKVKELFIFILVPSMSGVLTVILYDANYLKWFVVFLM